MKSIDPNVQRYKELLKLKRRALDQMRKHKKSLARIRVDKKRINEEITKLRKSGFAFAGMSTMEASARVSGEIRDVKPEDIYPRDLERQFDKLERTSEVKYKKASADLDDDDSGPKASRPSDDDAVFIGPNSGVMDLGESDADDTEVEPDGE
jgi:hypothetical protein